MLIIKAQIRRIDITKYTLQNKEDPVYSFLSLQWAMTSDVDLGSDHLRWIGEKRLEIYAVIRVFFLRRYMAKYSYIGEELKNKNDRFSTNVPKSPARSPKNNKIEETKENGGSIMKRLNVSEENSALKFSSSIFDEGEWKTKESK